MDLTVYGLRISKKKKKLDGTAIAHVLRSFYPTAYATHGLRITHLNTYGCRLPRTALPCARSAVAHTHHATTHTLHTTTTPHHLHHHTPPHKTYGSPAFAVYPTTVTHVGWIGCLVGWFYATPLATHHLPYTVPHTHTAPTHLRCRLPLTRPLTTHARGSPRLLCYPTRKSMVFHFLPHTTATRPRGVRHRFVPVTPHAPAAATPSGCFVPAYQLSPRVLPAARAADAVLPVLYSTTSHVSIPRYNTRTRVLRRAVSWHAAPLLVSLGPPLPCAAFAASVGKDSPPYSRASIAPYTVYKCSLFVADNRIPLHEGSSAPIPTYSPPQFSLPD